jgi:DNA-binding transcriptional ArsR family regulator
MLRFTAGPDDLLHSKFALSPIFELGNLVRLLAGFGRKEAPPVWLARLRPAFDRLRQETALDALLALESPWQGPDFSVPPPTRGMMQSIDDDLIAMRAVPLPVARRDIALCLKGRARPSAAIMSILDAPDVTAQIAGALDRAWHELIAADWLQLRAICERDVIYRSGQLARHGWAAALDGLHRRVRWRNGAIELTRMTPDKTVPLGGAGITFIPLVSMWPNLAAHSDDPWPKCIIYPARGAGLLWGAAPSPAPDALAELIGRSRAAILVALAEPASTTQLARSLALATGSVGDHLRALQRAGLLDATRSGRSVLYRRTPLGDMLAGS